MPPLRKGRGRLGRRGVREEKRGAGGKGRERGLAQTGRLQVLNGWFTTAKWVVTMAKWVVYEKGMC